MSLYNKLTEAWENHDVEAYWACFHPDWEMTWHSTGKVTNLNSMSAEQMKAIMENADVKNRRCIYENDDILVIHSVNDYPDKTREAVIAVYTLQDGKITGLETGATPL